VRQVDLILVKRTDPQILDEMSRHYSQPKGFVGRNMCYKIVYNDISYGHIVSGSATRFLVGRDNFLGIDCLKFLNNIINNIFYHVEPKNGEYPFRNFTSSVLLQWEKRTVVDWEQKYGDKVIALESLIELPRSGETYKRAGWTLVGQTKGFTCKRIAGKGTDDWTGKRVWDTENLRPKLVFVKKVT
jgi:hypothetical protein